MPRRSHKNIAVVWRNSADLVHFHVYLYSLVRWKRSPANLLHETSNVLKSLCIKMKMLEILDQKHFKLVR